MPATGIDRRFMSHTPCMQWLGTSDLPQTSLRRMQGRPGLGVRERCVLDVLQRAATTPWTALQFVPFNV